MQCSTYPISSTCCIVWYHIQSYYLNVTIVLFGGHLGLSQVLLANPAGIENLVLHLEHVLGGLAGLDVVGELEGVLVVHDLAVGADKRLCGLEYYMEKVNITAEK